MGRLSGKRAVVTGAAGGLGRAIAFAFAGEGAKVCILDINEDLLAEAQQAAGDLDVVTARCDVSSREQVFAAIDRFANEAGGLDILVNNAVRFHYSPLETFDPEIIDSMIDIGLKGVFWSFQAATPHLKASGGGSIINLSSIAVSMMIPNASVYTSIKGAMDALTRQQAGELGPFGIRVNAVAPGSVVTPGASSVIDEAGWESRKQKSPLKRLTTAEEVGKAAIYLASDDSVSVTGITLKVDAGMTITGP